MCFVDQYYNLLFLPLSSSHIYYLFTSPLFSFLLFSSLHFSSPLFFSLHLFSPLFSSLLFTSLLLSSPLFFSHYSSFHMQTCGWHICDLFPQSRPPPFQQHSCLFLFEYELERAGELSHRWWNDMNGLIDKLDVCLFFVFCLCVGYRLRWTVSNCVFLVVLIECVITSGLNDFSRSFSLLTLSVYTHSLLQSFTHLLIYVISHTLRWIR